MHGKICIVTGSNTGIGKETARGLAASGATVILACRDEAKAEAARADIAKSTKNPLVVAIPLDLADFASIRAFARSVGERYGKVDLLVNNAGVTARRRGVTKDGFETTFGVNHLGTALLTLELLDLLKKGDHARIVVLASGLHYRGKMAWADLQFTTRNYDGITAYNQSKLANVLFTKALATRLEGTGVTVNAVHPGVVATELTRDYPRAVIAVMQLFLLSPQRGAACSLFVATAPEIAGVTGEYFEKSRSKPASREARDVEAQERLWKLTLELLEQPAKLEKAA
jgi:NAD(P)-dependent dehydrogenase (short-subunit alcohol dehydrogenase family)